MGGPWGRQWAHLTEIEVAANRAAENMPIFQQQRPQDPWNDLHNAAHEGSFERTVALLSRRSLDVNQRTPEGYTPLMLSAELGYSSIVRVLLDRGANVCTVANDHGLTALHLSAQNGHQNVSILLVKAGADLQATVSGSFSPLHMAAQNGRVGVATALIKAGADLQAKTIIGATPLHMAAHNGHFEVSIALMEAGSDLQATTFGGSTPLHMSCNQGDVDVVAALVEAGADVEAADPKGVKPMHLAAEKGHSAVLTALIDAGANYDTRRPSGETPLYCAVFHGHLQAVRVLLRAKANPLLTRTDTEISLVPLGFASAFGYTEVVRELLQQAGIEGCGGESGGLDALRQAAERQHVDIMTMLTDAGVTDTGGALIDAAGIGHEWSVKSLLEQKKRKCANGTAYVNSRDRNGKTPLFSAINFGRCSPRVVRSLVDAGADTTSVVPVTSTLGVVSNETPLDTATRCLSTKIVDRQVATKEQMYGLEGIRRLLLRVEAVHAVSWLWHCGSPIIRSAPESSKKDKTITSTPLSAMLRALRRTTRRGVLLRSMFRREYFRQ